MESNILFSNIITRQVQGLSQQYLQKEKRTFGNYSVSSIRLWMMAFAVYFLLMPLMAQSQITYTLSKSNNATSPIASGQPFTYTLTYSWSGGAPGSLYIVDNVPATLDVISALPNSPVSTIVGNQVTFTLSGLALPSGSGTVQINVRFKPGVTCGGTKACNKAGITDNPNTGVFVYSNEDCVTADRKSTRLNSSHSDRSRMPSSA